MFCRTVRQQRTSRMESRMWLYLGLLPVILAAALRTLSKRAAVGLYVGRSSERSSGQRG